MNSLDQRSPLRVFLCVVIALFFRELKTRFGEYRLGYLWVVGEPVMHMLALSAMFREGSRQILYDIDYPTFLLTGLMAFDFITHCIIHSTEAIAANEGLFVYKQVKPFDILVARALMEFMVHLLAFLAILVFMMWLGFPMCPYDPLGVICVAIMTFLLGFGFSLNFAIMGCLFKDTRRIAGYMLRPLYFISCLFYPLSLVPQSLKPVVMANPITHISELMKMSWFKDYPDSGASWLYLSAVTLVSLTVGMILYRRYRYDLVKND
jgi:capsular polysaccharide transport system permease protein